MVDSVTRYDRNGKHSFQNTNTHLGDINLSLEVKNTEWNKTEAVTNGLSNVLFYSEIRPSFPPDLSLTIIFAVTDQWWRNDNNL